MSCAPCKVLMLKVAETLGKLGAEALSPEARVEIRQLKAMLIMTGYFVEDQELRESAKGRKRGKVCDFT